MATTMNVKKAFEPNSGKAVLQYSFPNSRKDIKVVLDEQGSKSWLIVKKGEKLPKEKMIEIMGDLNSIGVASLAKQNGKPFALQHSLCAWNKHLLEGQPFSKHLLGGQPTSN
ncbi:MAG: hypothetical protein WC861_03055 [Candidatus Micrarchaeia archaeon]|jgi:hypothetical protein